MSLSALTASDLKYSNFASGEYKGFSVTATTKRNGYSFSISLMLESDSDACHTIALDERASTLAELKAEAKAIINSYPYTAKQILELHLIADQNNLNTRKIHIKQGDTITEKTLN
ncbi:hypothetical protein FG062_14740 [Vibrio cholerae]|nr:hypothetical protein [Vibrio cholerae]EGR0600871.1 hypothetical protein [Vibrio cholerae]